MQCPATSNTNMDVDMASIPEEQLMNFGEFTAVLESWIKTRDFETKTILEKFEMVYDTIRENLLLIRR